MFWTRLFSGIGLIIVAFLSMFLGGMWLAVPVLLISLIAYLELTKALKVNQGEKRWNGLQVLGLIGVITYYGAVVFTKSDTMKLMCIVFVIMALMFLYVKEFPKYDTTQVLGAVFSFVYAPVMLSFIYLTRMTEYGIYMVWFIIISSWGCDTFAYVVGMLFGRKKIFPNLSPKKSLEGCIGGVIGAAGLGGLYMHFIVGNVMEGQRTTWIVMFICAAGAIMSMVGDLVASGIKRNHDIKDYGRCIPGHGGIMDRFDSVIVTAPMVYFLSVLLLNIK